MFALLIIIISVILPNEDNDKSKLNLVTIQFKFDLQDHNVRNVGDSLEMKLRN